MDQEITLDWQQFGALPWQTLDADFHCVTQWSALDQTWKGVALSDLLELAGVSPAARFVMAHCFGDYSTNLPLEIALDEGFLAHKQAGQPIGKSHGWPLRLIVPSLYGVEERQVDQRNRADGRGLPRLLGAARLPQQRRPMERRTILAGTVSLVGPMSTQKKRAAKWPPLRLAG